MNKNQHVIAAWWIFDIKLDQTRPSKKSSSQFRAEFTQEVITKSVSSRGQKKASNDDLCIEGFQDY